MSGHIATAANIGWCTSNRIVEAVHWFFGGPPELDPASNKDSIVRARVEYRMPERDGLIESWDYDTIFVNCPFGRTHTDPLSNEVLSAKEFADLRDRNPAEAERFSRSNTVADWIDRCCEARHEYGAEVILLVPAAVDTRYWHEIIWPYSDRVCFLKGREKFLGAPAAAPFATAIVYWGHAPEIFEFVFKDLGWVVKSSGN